MSLITRMRRQKAVWWARGSADTYGRFSYSAPVEIDCRWDDSSVEFRDATGQMVASKSTVYPDRVLGLGDKLKEGELDSNTPADPTDDDAAFEVRGFDKIPNLRATEKLYIAYL